MAEPTPPEVQPLALRWLLALSLGTFLVVFLVLEIVDPRWIGTPRGAPTPTALPTVAARVLRPLPTPRSRPSPSPRPAGQTTVVAGTPAAVGTETSGEPPDQSEANPTTAIVVETEGRGARLRASPSADADVLSVLAEGTTVALTGQDVEVEGRRWVEVRLPDGATGWVAADFLAAPEPTRPPG